MASHRFDGFTKISSGHMDGCKYDPVQRRMTLRYQNGYEYVVHGLSADSYQAFLAAPSQGTHWHTQIKDQYHIERVK